MKEITINLQVLSYHNQRKYVFTIALLTLSLSPIYVILDNFRKLNVNKNLVFCGKAINLFLLTLRPT